MNRIEEGKNKNTFNVSCEVANGLNAANECFRADVSDISTSGIGFYSEPFLENGKNVEIKIYGLPGIPDGKIQTKAVIQHCLVGADNEPSRKHRCGAKFIDMTEIDKNMLKSFILENNQRKEPRMSI